MKRATFQLLMKDRRTERAIARSAAQAIDGMAGTGDVALREGVKATSAADKQLYCELAASYFADAAQQAISALILLNDVIEDD